MTIMMSIKNIVLYAVCFAVFFVSSCAPRVAFKRDYDFSSIKKVGVLNFQSASLDALSSGDAISDEFVRQFLSMGITVVERQRINEVLMEKNFGDKEHVEALQRLNEKLGVDVVVTGTITKYVLDKKNYILLGDVTNPEADVRTRVITTNAEVGLSARMIDLKTGNIIWASSYSYESFNVEDALYGAVSYLVSGLKYVWPKLKEFR